MIPCAGKEPAPYPEGLAKKVYAHLWIFIAKKALKNCRIVVKSHSRNTDSCFLIFCQNLKCIRGSASLEQLSLETVA